MFYWKATLPFHVLFVEDGKLGKKEFIDIWKSIGDEKEVSEEVTLKYDLDRVKDELEAHNLFHIAQRRPDPGKVVSYFSLKTTTGSQVLTEITIEDHSQTAQICFRSTQELLIPFVSEAVRSLLA